jgi:ribosomal protein S12 methylthiotransferase
MEDSLPEHEKEQRASTIMDIQQEISSEINQLKIGQQFKTIIDRVEGEYYVGRSEHDSPEVDNEVLIKTDSNYARIGDFVQVQITDAVDYDLYGNVVPS